MEALDDDHTNLKVRLHSYDIQITSIVVNTLQVQAKEHKETKRGENFIVSLSLFC